MQNNTQNKIRKAVREHYAAIANRKTIRTDCCHPVSRETLSSATFCCDNRVDDKPGVAVAQRLGYSLEDISTMPESSNLGLGCGNPLAIASLRKGETVLDLGSGAGFDCFLAVKQVGKSGFVIGVDMTPAMVEKARDNAAKGDYRNVEFFLGEIEHLPVPDSSVDVIISNCVLNLSPDKRKVFKEAFRVLKPGGRLAISDLVALQPLPDEWRTDISLHVSCISGASPAEELRRLLAEAGFQNIQINVNARTAELLRDCSCGTNIENIDRIIASASIEAMKGRVKTEKKKLALQFFRSFE